MKIFFAIITILSVFIGVDCSGKVMKVADAWARMTPSETYQAAAYMTIQNKTGEPDKLVTITTYMSEKVDIIESKDVNGISETRTISELIIPADKDIVLSPQKIFIAFKTLKQPLTVGEKFPVTLTFEKAGAVMQDVVVEPAGTLTYQK